MHLGDICRKPAEALFRSTQNMKTRKEKEKERRKEKKKGLKNGKKKKYMLKRRMLFSFFYNSKLATD